LDLTDTISMQALARFSELDGAAELIDAYSRIPPGPLRANLVQQAAIIADQYTGGPLSMTLAPVAGAKAKAVTALPAPTRTGREPPTSTPQMQAVQLRIDNPDMTTAEIAKQTGLDKKQVTNAIHHAKKAGAPIPKKKLRSAEERLRSDHWITDLSQLSGQGLSAFERAADARRITPQGYLDRRLLALKLAMEGAGYVQICKETGEPDQKVVSAWLSKARGAGFAVPYININGAPEQAPQAAQEPAQAPKDPDPEPEPVATVQAASKRVFPAFSELSAKQAAPILFAARRRKLKPAAYQDLREAIVQHRLAGMTPKQIAEVTGQPAQFIKDTTDMAQDRGVVFPRLTKDGGAIANAQAEAEPQELEPAR
jgi:hypothetical protein